MREVWMFVVGCVLLAAGQVRAAAVPTQDTMVVARSDDDGASTTPEVTEFTTEEPVPPIKLTEMEVTSEIALRYAHTAVVTTVRNPAKRAQEFSFRVLLPETAFISGFTMTLDGKSYKAYVKEKEEAKQIYNQAISQGLGAGHVAAKARDSNQFTVSVNVEPNTVAVFNLTYEELLVRRSGVYNHAVNLHPGALVPRLTVTVNVREGQKITTLRVPEVRTGNEIDATEDDAQNSKAMIERSHNDREAKIVFKPNLDEQLRLIEIYKEKSRETRTPSHHYGYDDSDDDKKSTEGILGQFVVQYDVERPKEGEILVNDGYFVHFFAPADLPPLNKHVVFVLDTSGSMMDRKIIQLREAMQTILSELKQGDYFNIVEFSSSVKVYEMAEADREPPKQQYYSFHEHAAAPSLVPPAPATPENVAKAKIIVNRLYASGGTNIYSALDVAVSLIKKGVGWTPEKTANGSSTEGAPTTSSTSTAEIETTTATKDEESPSSLEPMIIFLTDGDPTVGVTDPTRIINHLTEKNAGYNKATIFSLAFGEDADRKFLKKLSLRNEGFVRHIYEAADAALQLRDFYRQVASPLLSHVKFIYPKKQVKEVTKQEFRRYYGGSEAVVAGRLESLAEFAPTVEAFCGVGRGLGGTKRYEILPKVPMEARKEKYLPLERVWAHLTVRQLLDERDAADRSDEDATQTPDKRALAIALKYEFVTPLTSLVVVKPNETAAVDAESVHKQNTAYGGFGGPGVAGFAAPMVPMRHNALSGQSSGPHHFYAHAVSRPAVVGGLALPQYSQISHSAHPGYPAAGLQGPPSYSFDAMSPMDVQEESIDDYDIGMRVDQSTPLLLSSTTPLLLTSPRPSSSSNAPPSVSTPLPVSSSPSTDRLTQYNLEGYDWIRLLLDEKNDTITLRFNSTNVTLFLAKDNIPLPSGSEAPCSLSSGDEKASQESSCVYLSRCGTAKTLGADVYASLYCIVNDRFAGVCCPKEQVDIKNSQ